MSDDVRRFVVVLVAAAIGWGIVEFWSRWRRRGASGSPDDGLQAERRQVDELRARMAERGRRRDELPPPAEIRTESEVLVLALGGELCGWLPMMEVTRPRSTEQLVGRTLVVSAMIRLPYAESSDVLLDWLTRNDLDRHLTPGERALLAKGPGGLTAQDLADLDWRVEALWALLWSGGVIDDLYFWQRASPRFVGLVPNPLAGDDPGRLASTIRRRTHVELHQERDLQYNVMWYARQSHLTRRPHPHFDLSLCMERRTAIEWVTDLDVDWDEPPMDT